MPDTLPPVDTSVSVPESVRRAAAEAEAAHKAAYQSSDAPPAADAAPAATPTWLAAEAAHKAAPAVASPHAEPTPPVTAPAPPAGERDWEARYNSMKGRFDQSQRTIGSMQAQMQELGDELVRTQAVLTPRQQPRQQPQQQPVKLLTDQDRADYGPELIDVVQRAAVEAVAPKLTRLEQENQQLRQRVQQQSQQGIYAALDAEVPNWRSVNGSDRFKAWCRLPDLYSGVLRGKLLNDAFRAGQTARVAQFFRGFLAEEVATGQEPAPLPPAVERTAAVPLETLTAPGRAKPATGADNTNTPADKPIITRAQIAAFYDQVRKGAYAGRDADKARDEAIIFAAQREGRTR